MLADSGEVCTFGNGSRGQLGHGKLQNEYVPRVVKQLPNKIVSIANGFNFTLFLTDQGVVHSTGDNSQG